MARPVRKRRVQAAPDYIQFGPRNMDCSNAEPVNLTVDEYETIRLIDLSGLTQAECAAHMGVARTTVQSIYRSARKKLARALVEGRELLIRGGDCVIFCEDTVNARGVPRRVCHIEKKSS